MKLRDLKNLSSSLVKEEKVIDDEVKIIDGEKEIKKTEHDKQKDFINLFSSMSRKQKRRIFPMLKGKKPVTHCKRCGFPWNNVKFVGKNENCRDCSSIMADEKKKRRRRKKR